MNAPSYCTQNAGHCSSCSLANYGRDCMNNKIIVDDHDDQFVADLLYAYEIETDRVRKFYFAYRICQLMLKGVKYERLEMRKKREYEEGYG
jgi:hypothetical protein